MERYSKSIAYYRQYYKLIAVAVVIMMAVLSGSLLLGDSVRRTLVDRVNERLGDTETVITSGTGFFSDAIADAPLLKNARSYLVCEGFVSSEGKLIGVQVWCCDKDSIAMGEAVINEPLGRQISGEDIVLHLPSHSLVPSGSLFVTKRYSTQVRLHVQGVRTVEEGGNLLLHNEQKLPLNIFMNREELASAMGLEGKVNLIMSPDNITEEAFSQIWTPEMSGYNISSPQGKTGEVSVTSDRIFLSQSLVEALHPERLCFAYLVNDLTKGERSVPYSFVTATDKWQGMPLKGDEMILSDYAASRLNSRIGDSIGMEYYVSPGMKALETRSHKFVIKDIVALDDIKKDSLLMTEYPGLSKVEHCNDWDSDLPVDMNRISKEDENYWYKHRHTPKAIVAYDAVKQDWCSSFGVATAVSVADTTMLSAPSLYGKVGIGILHPRESAIYAANNGTDFSSLFLALGFFIILSGILLMQTPLVEMLTERRDEIALYKSLGYKDRRIYGILLRETGRVLLFALPVGVIVGMLYSGITLFLLGNVWSGATHTEGFHLHISILTIVISLLVGMAICMITLIVTIRKAFRQEKEMSKSRHLDTSKSRYFDTLKNKGKLSHLLLKGLLILSLLPLLWVGKGVGPLLFVICGILWLIASGMLFISFIQGKANEKTSFSSSAMIWKTLASQRSQVRLSFWALAVGVFTVFAVGLNRPDFSHASDDKTMTGGFNLWCENQVPIEYDLNNKAVRKKLSLQDISDSTFFLQFNKYTQDEASCLNLNKVSTPTVLGCDTKALQDYFDIDTAPLQNASADGTIPVLIDSESLTWSLMKSVGDTLFYNGNDGDTLRLVIAGSYPTGIFHGNALMNKEHFRLLWKDETGSRIILARTGSDAYEETKDLMETALSEYGVSISTTTDRINLFFTVTDTYLAIFLTLGGLGLIVGIFCLIIVVRKNLTSRRTEIETLSSLGFSNQKIKGNLLRENLIVPLAAIISGSIGSLISISANATGAGLSTILTAVIFLFLLLAFAYLGIKKIIAAGFSGKIKPSPSKNI